MNRSKKTARPRASIALPSRSNSMMSSGVTSAGASERDIRKRFGSLGWRRVTCPKPSSTPRSARMRLPPPRAGGGGAARGREGVEQGRVHRRPGSRLGLSRRRDGEAQEDEGGAEAAGGGD